MYASVEFSTYFHDMKSPSLNDILHSVYAFQYTHRDIYMYIIVWFFLKC